jgi:DNA invertase Pin-like site-specific DNA recombinase
MSVSLARPSSPTWPYLQPVRRGIGIVRVSHAGKRKLKGDRFVSPAEQRQRITGWFEREGIVLVAIYEELDTSGGRPLVQRIKGLLPAVERIEAGVADVVCVAYFDRLLRSLEVQIEFLKRVEAANGSVVALDVGEVFYNAGTPAEWLNATMHGMMAEYYRRQIGHKTMIAKADAIARGVATFPLIIPGYRRGTDGRLMIERTEAAHVRRAFELRLAGHSLFEIRDYLREHGIERSYRSVQTLLASRVVLGEIQSGKLVNPKAHEPIVDRLLWQRVQDVKVPHGKRVPSERLLARAGVLRCATCGSAMGATWGYKQRGGKRYWKYVCGMRTECSAPAMISATVVEEAVAADVRRRLANESESASLESNLAEAEVGLARAQTLLDAAVAAFDGIDVQSVHERLKRLQADVQAADDRVQQLRAATVPTEVVNASADWDAVDSDGEPLLSIDGRRALIRALIERVEVLPGRSRERISIQPFR